MATKAAPAAAPATKKKDEEFNVEELAEYEEEDAGATAAEAAPAKDGVAKKYV